MPGRMNTMHIDIAGEQDAPIAFISGPLSPPVDYFEKYYLPHVAKAMENGHRFVMGPSRGIDTIALEHLLKSGVDPTRITVFLAKDQENQRKSYADFESEGGNVVVIDKKGHAARDEACTRNSHYDILRYFTVEEQKQLYGKNYRERISGTQHNEIRRKKGLGLTWEDETYEGANGEAISTEKVIYKNKKDGDMKHMDTSDIEEVETKRQDLVAKVREARDLSEKLGQGSRLDPAETKKVRGLNNLEAKLEGLGEATLDSAARA